jgi:prepilin-type processing-associated H-X9-DG protein
MVVVAFLAAILFPVFARARAKAEQASCMANIKQLMLAEAMYATDYDNRLPSAGDWPQKLYPDYKNDMILLCPADKRPDKQKSADKPTSYTMSDALGGLGMETLRDPQNLGVLFDGTQLYGLTGAADYRHNDGLNVGYADGHARWLNQEAFATVPLQPTPESGTPGP